MNNDAYRHHLPVARTAIADVFGLIGLGRADPSDCDSHQAIWPWFKAFMAKIGLPEPRPRFYECLKRLKDASNSDIVATAVLLLWIHRDTVSEPSELWGGEGPDDLGVGSLDLSIGGFRRAVEAHRSMKRRLIAADGPSRLAALVARSTNATETDWRSGLVDVDFQRAYEQYLLDPQELHADVHELFSAVRPAMGEILRRIDGVSTLAEAIRDKLDALAAALRDVMQQTVESRARSRSGGVERAVLELTQIRGTYHEATVTLTGGDFAPDLGVWKDPAAFAFGEDNRYRLSIVPAVSNSRTLIDVLVRGSEPELRERFHLGEAAIGIQGHASSATFRLVRAYAPELIRGAIRTCWLATCADHQLVAALADGRFESDEGELDRMATRRLNEVRDITKWPEDLSILRFLQFVVSTACLDGPIDDSQETFRQRACQLLHRADQLAESAPDQALAQSVAAIEVCLCQPHESGISAAVAARFGRLLVPELRTRERGERFMKQLYHLRSRIVHGSWTSAVSAEQVILARTTASSVVFATCGLAAYLEKVTGRREISVHDIVKQLDTDKFGAGLLPGVFSSEYLQSLVHSERS